MSLPDTIPNVDLLKPLFYDFVGRLQEILKEKGVICTRGRWYPYKGVDFFRIYNSPACAWPKGIYIDSTEYFRYGRLYIKLLFDPLVVEGIKIGGVILPPDMDGWTTNFSPGWQAARQEFFRNPCLLLDDLLYTKTYLEIWKEIVSKSLAGNKNPHEVVTKLEIIGLEEDGSPHLQSTALELVEGVMTTV